LFLSRTELRYPSRSVRNIHTVTCRRTIIITPTAIRIPNPSHLWFT